MRRLYTSRRRAMKLRRRQLRAISVDAGPTRVVEGSGVLVLDAGVDVRFVGYRDARLERASRRFITRLEALTGVSGAEREDGLPLEIRCGRDGDTPESYSLEVTSAAARLEADTVVGVLRGLETLLQLVRVTEHGFTVPRDSHRRRCPSIFLAWSLARRLPPHRRARGGATTRPRSSELSSSS